VAVIIGNNVLVSIKFLDQKIFINLFVFKTIIVYTALQMINMRIISRNIFKKYCVTI
jgi:hypothetical protein